VGLLARPSPANLPALASWADQVNPRHVTADRSYVEAVRAAGMECHVWTPDRRPALQRSLRNGVDGVITNRPDVLLDLLAEREGPVVSPVASPSRLPDAP
jgi:glycerophosphoryl diester phosphodiesterase